MGYIQVLFVCFCELGYAMCIALNKMFRRCIWHLLLFCEKYWAWYHLILLHSLREDFVLTVIYISDMVSI